MQWVMWKQDHTMACKPDWSTSPLGLRWMTHSPSMWYDATQTTDTKSDGWWPGWKWSDACGPFRGGRVPVRWRQSLNVFEPEKSFADCLTVENKWSLCLTAIRSRALYLRSHWNHPWVVFSKTCIHFFPKIQRQTSECVLQISYVD